MNIYYLHQKMMMIVFLLLGVVSRPYAQSVLDVETSIVISGYNDVAVPGDNGTRFSLTEDLDADQTGAFRLRYGKTLSERHWIGVLVAPLTIKSHGTLAKSVDFDGTTFPEGSSVDAKFRFDSYRFIYRYHLHQSDVFQASIGGALKVRSAEIRLESEGRKAEKENIGLVPLLSFDVTFKPFEKIHFLIDGEALAAPQGRAEDVLFAVKYRVNDSLSFKTGYRLLEGGADNDEVYTFSLFHYFLVGAAWSF